MTSLSDLPAMTAPALRRATKGQVRRLMVCPYDTREWWMMRSLLITDAVQRTTAVLEPGARKAVRRNVRALAVPSLEVLQLGEVQALAHLVTDFITLREPPPVGARLGPAGKRVVAPWEVERLERRGVPRQVLQAAMGEV